jgi:very-short-patch-repair endonuclease
MKINACIPAWQREYLSNITRTFEGEEIQLEFRVLKYIIDLYFIEYKLAIEFDEENQTYDKIRQTKIEEQLGCTFIRFTKKDSIFQVINKIHSNIARADMN